jgi:hypothetical protein
MIDTCILHKNQNGESPECPKCKMPKIGDLIDRLRLLTCGVLNIMLVLYARAEVSFAWAIEMVNKSRRKVLFFCTIG